MRSSPSAADLSIAKIASGQMYIASEVVKKEDEEWIRLHPQTLHTYRLPDKPCWIAVYLKNETRFLKKVDFAKCVCLFKIVPLSAATWFQWSLTQIRSSHAER